MAWISTGKEYSVASECLSEEVVKDIFLYKITTKVLINACDDTIAHLKSKLSKPFLWHDMLRSDLKNVLKVGMTENVRELREEAVVDYFFLTLGLSY